jgi:hypothetical protein
MALAAATCLWTGAVVASLHWRFLDRFCLGTQSGRMGIDFFAGPRGYDNLFHGNSVFLTELNQFGPDCSPFLAHPCAAVAVGSWTFWLGTWAGYYAFVGLSLALLLLGAWLLASALDGPAWKAFAYFVMFCSMPVYLMLWTGQPHVLLVVSVALILAGLMRMEGDDRNSTRYLRWIQAGILISLLSKPAVLLMLPVLLITRETRKWVLLPVAIYAAVSIVFLTVPALNPGGYNATHWINMLVASSSPYPTNWVLSPRVEDYTKNPEIYALPMLLYRFVAHWLPAAVKGSLAVVIFGLSVAPLLPSEKSARLRAAVVAVCLCVLMHYLTYYIVFEYQYGTLLPLLPAHVWLWRRERARGLRRLLMASFAVSLLIFLPTLNFLAPADPNRYWAISCLLRVGPVVAAFLCLVFYGVALAWRAASRSAFRGMADQVWPILRWGGAAGAILGVVLLVVCDTSPIRIWKKPSSWTRQDWIVHFEDMVGRDGVSPNLRASLHRGLARCYATIDPAAALRHYGAALATRRNANVVVEMGDMLALHRRYGEAQKCYLEIAKIAPQNPAIQARLTCVNRLIAEQSH